MNRVEWRVGDTNRSRTDGGTCILLTNHSVAYEDRNCRNWQYLDTHNIRLPVCLSTCLPACALPRPS